MYKWLEGFGKGFKGDDPSTWHIDPPFPSLSATYDIFHKSLSGVDYTSGAVLVLTLGLAVDCLFDME